MAHLSIVIVNMVVVDAAFVLFGMYLLDICACCYFVCLFVCLFV